MPSDRILITGASGLAGRACMEHYAKAGYSVLAVSRNPPLNTYGAQWMSLDLSDSAACTTALSPLSYIIQIVFAALHEEPNLLAGWTQPSHIERNRAMLRNTLDAVLHGETGKQGTLKNVTILQGAKAYGAHVHPIRTGAREDRDEDKTIPNFYWAQEDYLKAAQKSYAISHPDRTPWTYNALRPALVVGMSSAGAMNFVAVLGVYASILKERGQKLTYPGHGVGIGEATDTRIIAACCEFVLQNRERIDVGNQSFNLTNGEMGSVYEDWGFLASLFGMEAEFPPPPPGTGSAPPDPTFSFRNDLPKLSQEWDAIRTKYNLKAPALSTFLGQSTQFADFVFARRNKPPSSMSTIKVRRTGFNETIYTQDMYRQWFEKYRCEGLLPAL
jgi:nucleoside-diphosphate-sugar epimerase